MATKQETVTIKLKTPVVYQDSYSSEVLKTEHKNKTQIGSASYGGYRGRTGSYTGEETGGVKIVARTVLLFDMPLISNLISIDSATLKMWKHWDSNHPSSGAHTYARQVTEWKNIGGVGWNNKPTKYNEAVADYTVRHYGFSPNRSEWEANFNVTPIVKNWYAGQKNLGIQLDSIGHESVSKHSWKKWWLDNEFEPRIEIRYTSGIVEVPNVLPTISITVPTNGLVNIPISIGCTASDSDGTINNISWSISVSNAADLSKLGINGGLITFNRSGNYTITATATDNRNGAATASKPISIALPPRDVIAGFNLSTNKIYTNSTITVTDQTYNPDNVAVSRAWAVTPMTGVTSTLNGLGGTIQFTQAGQYTVSLTVSYGAGLTSVFTSTLTVVVPDIRVDFNMSDYIMHRGDLAFYTEVIYNPLNVPITKTWSVSPAIGVTQNTIDRTFTFTELGDFTLTLTVEDDLSNTFAKSKIITVSNVKAHPFTISGPVNCSTIYNKQPIIYLTGETNEDGEYDTTYKISVEVSTSSSSFTTVYDSTTYAGFQPANIYDSKTHIMCQLEEVAVGQTLYIRTRTHDGIEWGYYSPVCSVYVSDVNLNNNDFVSFHTMSKIYKCINDQLSAYGLLRIIADLPKTFTDDVDDLYMWILKDSIDRLKYLMIQFTGNSEIIEYEWDDIENKTITRSDFQQLIDILKMM